MSALTIRMNDKLETRELVRRQMPVREPDGVRHKRPPHAEAMGYLFDADFFREIS